MIGRQVIPINKPITMQELEQIMQEHWDKEQYGNFKIGRPTKASIEEYILLPATHRYLIIVYPRKAGGLFSKEDKVILSTADTPQGAEIAVAEYFPTRGPLTKTAADQQCAECGERAERSRRRSPAGMYCPHEGNSERERSAQIRETACMTTVRRLLSFLMSGSLIRCRQIISGFRFAKTPRNASGYSHAAESGFSK